MERLNPKVRANHSSWVSGGRGFANRLAKIPGVRSVTAGPRSRRKSFSEKFRIKPTATSIRVDYGVGDGHQVFYVTPDSGLTLSGLEEKLSAELGVEHMEDEPMAGDRADAVSSELAETPVAEAATEFLPAGETGSAVIEVSRLFKIRLTEAQALVAECPHGLPRYFEAGARARLGGDLWGALKRFAYVRSAGYGRGTISEPVAEMFRITRFVVYDRQGKFKVRLAEIPHAQRFVRPVFGWLDDIRKQISALPAAEASAKSAPPASTPRAFDLSTPISMLEEMAGHLKRRRDELEARLSPQIAELQNMDTKLSELLVKIEELKKLQSG